MTDIVDITIPIERGAITKVPVYCEHARGRNWAATIQLDPRSPGGLRRDFWERARGDYYYLVPEGISPGVAVEFGADYYTGSGRQQRSRWYGYVVAIHSNRIVLHPCADARQACCEGGQALIPDESTVDIDPLPDIPTEVLIRALRSRGFDIAV